MRARGTPKTARQAATRGIGVMVALAMTAFTSALGIALVMLWLVD